MSKFVTDYTNWPGKSIVRNVKVGEVYWFIAPQVGHMLQSDSGYDFIGRVKILKTKEYNSGPDFVMAEPIKILFGRLNSGSWTSSAFCYTEEEVFNFTNKDLVIRLLFEGTRLLEKIKAIAPLPKPPSNKPLPSHEDFNITIKNFDENQETGLEDEEIFYEVIKGYEKTIFVLDNNHSIVKNIKYLRQGEYSDAEITIRIRKGKKKEAQEIIKKRLLKVLKNYAIDNRTKNKYEL